MNIALIRELGDRLDTLVIPLFEGESLPESIRRIGRKFSIDPDRLITDFEGKRNEVLSTYVKKKGFTFRLFLLGLGEDTSGLRVTSLRKFFHAHAKQMGAAATVMFNYVSVKHHADLAELFVMAAITGSYDLGLYKTGEKSQPELRLNLLSTKPLEAHVNKAVSIGETQIRIMDLVNAPANRLTPQDLGEWAKQSGQNFGYDVKVLDKAAIQSNKLNALLAVNQGSALPPTFIIAEYKSGDAEHTVGLVGKGVTFDTGGLSIKGSANMHYMKSDMGGAAAVLGTIELVARLKLPIHVVAIVPATENAVDAKAVKPGDIIESHSGKTIEVIDTDAEGRLILADALAYMTKNYKTDYLIDYATLTGSVIATLGYHAAGVFTKNPSLQKQLIEAGEQSGEKLWPLPIWDDYKEDLESDVADVKNYSGKPLAGAITAAKFLEVFINDHPVWAHVDIAGTAFGDTEFGKQKNATAFGIRLNLSFLESLLKG